METREILQRIDFFSGLEDKLLRKVEEAVIARQFAKDEVIINQGDSGLGLYVIVQGHVKVEREHNGTRVQVAELGPEQFFAEMSIVDNKPRSATVTTTEETECLLLTRDSFVKLMQKYPELPIRVARLLADRLRAANERMAEAASAPSPQASPQAPARETAAAASDNGKGGVLTAQLDPGGAKAKVQSALLSAFQSLYTMKAFTRFTVAVLGCPVEGASADLVEEIRAGDVKALIFPADRPVEVGITATEAGAFTLSVFTPDRDAPVCYGPVEISPQDDVQLLLPDTRDMTLTRGGLPLAPHSGQPVPGTF